MRGFKGKVYPIFEFMGKFIIILDHYYQRMAVHQCLLNYTFMILSIKVRISKALGKINNILLNLQNILDEYNPYIKSFHQVKVISSNTTFEISMLIIHSDRTHNP